MSHQHSQDGSFPAPCPNTHSATAPKVPGSEAHACTHPFPRANGSGAMGCSQLLGVPTWVVIQETWGVAASAPGKRAEVASPGAQQSLDSEWDAHQEAGSSDSAGLPRGPRPPSDSASPDSGGMGEGLRGCFPKTQAAGGEGADRVGLAIPFLAPGMASSQQPFKASLTWLYR